MKKFSKDNYLSISQFSKIAEVSRKALIFYDNIGLFSPDVTDSNGYRYYSHEQIYIISVINTLKELGMPLSEIPRQYSFSMVRRGIFRVSVLFYFSNNFARAGTTSLITVREVLMQISKFNLSPHL